MPFRSFLGLMLICVVWALNVVVSKLVVGDLGVPPIFYAALRAAVVAIALIPVFRTLPPQWFKTAAVGFAISGGSFALLFLGLKSATPASAAIVNLSGAPLTVLFAILLLKEKIGWRRGVGIAVTFIGVVIAIASPSSMEASSGLYLIAGSAAVAALGAVVLKQLESSAAQVQAWAGLASVIVLLPLSAVTESGQFSAVLAAGWRFVAALCFSGLVVSVLAHTAYFRMLKTYDANLIAPLTLMTPILTIVFGAWLTRDPVGILLITGAGIAVLGVLIIILRPARTYRRGYLVRARL
ncbi:DMT family transporter [Stakelama pacifica]|uniref:O-acetylserine/cysteine efflux transporter n=1 Tax=Stakelama pacifica TaxID=517720 RepID=A0A4R6FWI1_9SPHN|nr:DMT family transporter [Stakelama pacifica]TDN85384.1 O-acetylserine/cysteine efflux transporter [Stakelama pacifica]GGO92810.1 membrane protein [Stakelama pacifica]